LFGPVGLCKAALHTRRRDEVQKPKSGSDFKEEEFNSGTASRGGLSRVTGSTSRNALPRYGSTAGSGQGAPVRSSPPARDELSNAVTSSETHTEYARDYYFQHGQIEPSFVPCSNAAAGRFVPGWAGSRSKGNH
jgi:hypothetical protein